MIIPASLRPKLLLLATMVFIAASVVILSQSLGLEVSQIIANAAFVAVGALIVLRRPGNIIGPFLVAIGVLWTVLLAGDLVAVAIAESGNDAGASWLALVFASLVPPIVWLFIPLLLLFPNSRFESKLARPLLWGSAFLALIAAVMAFFSRPTVVPDDQRHSHPFLDDGVADSMASASLFMMFGLIMLLVVAAGMLIARIRHSGPVERRQIGWFGYAAALYFLISLFNVFVDPLGSLEGGFFFVDAIGFILIPLAVGIAIMRYRLYDIDRIVNRTVVYGTVVLLLVGVYAGAVVLLRGFLPDGSDLAVAASTLAVAALFNPIRLRVQRFVDRRFYRARYDAERTIQEFSAHIGNEVDLDQCTDELLSTVNQALKPVTATVWLRSRT